MTTLALGREDPDPDEDRLMQSILQAIERSLEKDYGSTQPGRRFHAKSLGLLDAVFEVEPGLSRELQVGLFASPRAFPALVRFSNAARMAGADDTRSTKGMAIKILDAPASGFEVDPCGTTQDLVLITSTVFFPGTVRKYALSLRGLFGNFLCLLAIALNPCNWRSLLAMVRRQRRVPNLLEEMYASCTPYLFGDGNAVKWHARPHKPATSKLPDHPDRDFLRHRLRDDLATTAASFEICPKSASSGCGSRIAATFPQLYASSVVDPGVPPDIRARRCLRARSSAGACRAVAHRSAALDPGSRRCRDRAPDGCGAGARPGSRADR